MLPHSTPVNWFHSCPYRCVADTGCVHILSHILLQFQRWLITSAKEVIFLPGFVCGFVSLFVNKITQKLMYGF